VFRPRPGTQLLDEASRHLSFQDHGLYDLYQRDSYYLSRSVLIRGGESSDKEVCAKLAAAGEALFLGGCGIERSGIGVDAGCIKLGGLLRARILRRWCYRITTEGEGEGGSTSRQQRLVRFDLRGAYDEDGGWRPPGGAESQKRAPTWRWTVPGLGEDITHPYQGGPVGRVGRGGSVWSSTILLPVLRSPRYPK